MWRERYGLMRYMEKPTAKAEVMQILVRTRSRPRVSSSGFVPRIGCSTDDGRSTSSTGVMRILSEGRRRRACMAPMSEWSRDYASPDQPHNAKEMAPGARPTADEERHDSLVGLRQRAALAAEHDLPGIGRERSRGHPAPLYGSTR